MQGEAELRDLFPHLQGGPGLREVEVQQGPRRAANVSTGKNVVAS